jgi:hypothetical protein
MMGIDDMNMIFDYFPLDEVESSAPQFSFATGKQSDHVSELSIFQRASIRLRKSLRNRFAYR